MKLIKANKDEYNLYKTHVLGDPSVNEFLADYTYPGEALFFMQINLSEYNFCGLDEGVLYVFFDLSGYYSEEYNELSLCPMAYHITDSYEYILDDFNEGHDIEGYDVMYLLDKGEGIEIDENSIIIIDNNLLDFFLNFTQKVNKVTLSFEKIEHNRFCEGIFKIE